MRGDAPALEEDMRELNRILLHLPGTSLILADCGLSENARKTARYLAGRDGNAVLVDAQTWKIN